MAATLFMLTLFNVFSSIKINLNGVKID